MRRLSLLIAGLLFAACGGQTNENPDFNSMRGTGKADGMVDTTLTCQAMCGGLATGLWGYCGCDDLCTTYGDCCDDKAAVCDGTSSDAIVIDKSHNGQSKTIKVGDTIDVQLGGNPTTGYAWHLLASSRSFPLQKEEYIPDEPQLTGSGGTYHFFFTADNFAAGNTFELRFAYYRSWEGVDAALETFSVKIAVQPSEAQCMSIDSDYAIAVKAAKACTADSDCNSFVGGSLSCGIPLEAVNDAYQAQIDSVKQTWSLAKCEMVPWVCPMLAPLPPYLKPVGICDQGSCKVEYIDTRGAKEGEACGDDIDVQCAEGLYCAFGLNWCGTPPVTGICRQVGDCGAASDCYNNDNSWIHPMCMGEATCENGKCGWDCSVP